MTSEPGVLEKNYEELDLNLMAPKLVEAIFAVKEELKRVTLEEQHENPEKAKDELIALPKNIDTDLAEMSENLEASKNSWFELLFGVVK